MAACPTLGPQIGYIPHTSTSFEADIGAVSNIMSEEVVESMVSPSTVLPESTPTTLPQEPDTLLSQQPGSNLKAAGANQRRRMSKGAMGSSALKRSASSPNVRKLMTPSETAMSLAEKRRNKLGYHRTSVACGECFQDLEN